MKVVVDLDGVIRDFDSKVRGLYIKKYPGKWCKPVETWDIANGYEIGKDIYQFITDNMEEIFTTADPYPGALPFLKNLREITDKILIVTSPWRVPEANHFNFIWAGKHAIDADALHNTSEKHLISADFYLDDNPVQLTKYSELIRSFWEPPFVFCFDQPWNKTYFGKMHLRTNSYKEILRYISTVERKGMKDESKGL